MANGLILGEDKRVTEWVFATFGMRPAMHVDRALGIIGARGSLVGAILFRNYNGVNVELSYYGPRTMSPGIVRSIARFGMTQFNPARATILTSKRNRHLISSLQKFGWKLEGAQRCYYGHKDCHRNTAIRMVMFRDQIERIAGLVPISQDQKQG